MKKIILRLFFISISAFSSSMLVAGGAIDHHVDPLSKTFIENPRQLPDKNYQLTLRKQASWENFAKGNEGWQVVFNESSAMPHRAFGTPISVPGYDARSTAENFISNQLKNFRVPFSNLKFRSAVANQKYHYVSYTQYYQGMEVLFSNVQVRLTGDYRVNQFVLDCYPNLVVSTSPQISENDAVDFAGKNVPGVQQIIIAPDLKVLPVPMTRNYEFKLVYEVVVENIDEAGVPGKYYTLIDAANGKVLYRANQVNHIANTDVNVSGTLYLSNPYQSATIEPLKNLRVVDGSNIYYTDDTGYLGLNNTTSTTATFSLQGKWVRIKTNNVTPVWTVNLTPGVNNVFIDSSNNDIKQRTTYNAINSVHEYMKTKFPAFMGLDFPMPANIDVAGQCNAFYNGSSVNFFDSGGGCNPSSLVVDVCYHEYGHGINDKFYQSIGTSFNNGAMGEGYADLWALGITTSPILGIGFFDSNPYGYIRRYDINKKIYPQNLVGEVHADGEIIAGCFWDTGLNLGNLQQMMDLFKETYYAGITGPNGNEGQLFQDVLYETLAQDDNDGDLTNGTPNYCPILAAFELHGITLGTTPLLCEPIAQFSYSPTVICEGNSISFNDDSFFPDTWSWSFPGGTPSSSTLENPVVNYSSAGVYDVTLTVTNQGGTNAITKTAIISVLPGTGQYAIPFQESFETITFPGTEWGWENSGGIAWEQTTIAAKTGSNSVYLNNLNGNTAGSVDAFITPSYNLSSSTSNVMTFALAFATTAPTSSDKLKVFASTTCGQLWNIRYTKYGANLATTSPVTGPFIPDPTQWNTQTVNISSISYNNAPNVRFKFEYTHDTGNDLFIDDINISGTVGMNELTQENINFNVYPNPVSSHATVSFTIEKSAVIFIDVTDVMGREVNKISETRLSAGDYEFELPVDLVNGLYNVRINVDGASISKKVIVTR